MKPIKVSKKKSKPKFTVKVKLEELDKVFPQRLYAK